MNLLKSKQFPINGVAVSYQGGRPENQDDFGCIDTPLGFLLVVCDGMGGGPGGKTASYMVKCEIAAALGECNPQTPKDYALKKAAARAHEALLQKMREVPALQGMGSTFVAVLIDNKSAFVAHAGDSRCYLLRGNRCVYRSQDHSLVADLVRSKALTEEEARVSPQSNIITRGLGNTSNPAPEIDEVAFRKGDRFILCTDGVWGSMPHPDLLRAFFQKKETSILADRLAIEIDRIGFAKGGGHDNHTLAIVEVGFDSEKKEKNDFLRSRTFIFSVVACLLVLFSVGVYSAMSDMLQNLVANNSSATSSTGSMPFPDEPRGSVGVVDTIKADTSKIDLGITNKSIHKKMQDIRESMKEKMKKDSLRKDSLRKKKDTDVPKDKNVSEQQKKAPEQQKKDVQKKDGQKKSPEQKDKKDVKQPQNVPLHLVLLMDDRYKKAKAVAEDSEKAAVKKVEAYRDEIKSLMKDFLEKAKAANVRSLAEAIDKQIDFERTWKIDVANDKGKFCPTRKAKGEMDKQIERLGKLKERVISAKE